MRDLFLILFGAFLGLGTSILLEYIKLIWNQHKQFEYSKKIYSALIKEVEEGVERCEGLAEFLDQKTYSLGRIYTKFWDSLIDQLPQKIEDPEILVRFHSIYKRFDLVNFNLNRNLLGPGAAFAKKYLEEMKINLSELRSLSIPAPSPLLYRLKIYIKNIISSLQGH